MEILIKNNIFFFDSKILKPREREIFSKIIKKIGLKYKIVSISNKKIDKIGIGKALIYGINKIIKYFKPESLILDGQKLKYLNYKNTYFFVKGDKNLNSIGASSILAKTHRDKYMKNISRKYPLYLFDVHKGYGTKKHYQLIKKFGICPLHRISFLKNQIKK